jgi:hypothetical protein
MTLANWVFTYAGLTIGGLANNVSVTQIQGLEDLSDIVAADVNRPRAPGMLAGLDFPAGRTVTMDLEVTAAAGKTLAQSVDTVKAALIPSMNTELPLAMFFPGWTDNRVFNSRVRKYTSAVNAGYVGGIALISGVQFTGVDPRLYGQTVQSTTVTLPTPSSGLTFPITFPLTFGGTTGGGGVITAVNTGTYPTPVIFTVTGPCVNPRIQNETTGTQLAFDITLGSTDTLTVSTDAQTAFFDVTGDVAFAIVPGSSFDNPNGYLPPGTTNIGFFSSDASPTGATLTAKWQNAWL